MPGVLPFEVYAQAPLRLISWCSFELDYRARALLRELAILCESSITSTEQLVPKIAQRQFNVNTEQDAIQYLATLATVQIASRAQMPNYTTMVQHFLGTLQLPMAIYMLDYYLPMLSPNDGYNETGLTMQSAGPIREAWQPILFSYLFKGSEFGHWKVTGGYDTFAFRHPSLGQADVRQLLESEAHHHKICPIGTGRLIAMVGVAPTDDRTRNATGVVRASSQHYAQNEQKQKRAACSPNIPPMQSQSHRSSISNHTSHGILCRGSVPSAANTLLGPWVWPRTHGPWMLPSIMTHLSCPRPSYCRTCGCLALLNLPVN